MLRGQPALTRTGLWPSPAWLICTPTCGNPDTSRVKRCSPAHRPPPREVSPPWSPKGTHPPVAQPPGVCEQVGAPRARVRVFSDDGLCVSDPLLMRRALEYVKAFDGVIAQHAQDPRLTVGAQMNEGALSGEIGMVGWPGVA